MHYEPKEVPYWNTKHVFSRVHLEAMMSHLGECLSYIDNMGGDIHWFDYYIIYVDFHTFVDELMED